METDNIQATPDPSYSPFQWALEPDICNCVSSQQIDALATFIMTEVPGEPSQSEGAVETAIRLIRELVEIKKGFEQLQLVIKKEE